MGVDVIAERLVQIWVDVADGTFGSGFLLNGGVILTARHVIAPNDDIPATLEIQVRIGAPAKGGWKKAGLIWPQHAALREGPDVALLQLDEKPVASASTWPIVGFPDAEDGSPLMTPLAITAIGFPTFAEVSSRDRRDKRRESYQLQGVAPPLAGLIGGTLQIDKTEVVPFESSPHASANLDWTGLSGAAIFCMNTYLIGVITNVPQGGYYGFGGARIDALFEDPDFKAAFAGAATPATQPAKVEVPHLEQLVYLVDRDLQEADLVDEYDLGRPAFICCVPSADNRHLPEDLPDRFSQKTLPDRLNWPPGTTACQWITWPPPGHRSPLVRLRSELWNRLGKTGKVPVDSESFRALLLNESRSRFFGSDLREHELSAELGVIVCEWSRFILASAPGDGRSLVYVVLVKATKSELTIWKEAITAADAGAPPEAPISGLAELSKCGRLHVKRWFSEHLRPRFSSQARVLDDLESTLTLEMGDFFVEDLKSRVRQCMEERRRG